jgi:hypothetical protein
MSITTTWATVRSTAIQGFNGELPVAATEQALIDAFEQEPLAVMHARDQVIEDFRRGKARSGWAVWKSRVALQTARNPSVDVSNRPKAIIAAEAWIRHAGGYLDRETEVIDELFGDTGKLREWPDLQPRMLELWHAARPRFEAAEKAAEERAAKLVEARARIRAASNSHSLDIDPDQHAANITAEVERATQPHHNELAYLDSIIQPEKTEAA